MKFKGSSRFMSNLTENLSDKLNGKKCDSCKCLLEFGKVKDNLLLCNCRKYEKLLLIKI